MALSLRGKGTGDGAVAFITEETGVPKTTAAQ
jgi:hypothetical protein